MASTTHQARAAWKLALIVDAHEQSLDYGGQDFRDV
jgi:hypothetical protein